MQEPLQQITLSAQNTIQAPTKQKQQLLTDSVSDKSLKKLIRLSSKCLDFGHCLPGAVHQMKFSLSLMENLTQPITVRIVIKTDDQQLNSLSEFIFAIRREKQQTYMDEFLMKIQKKGIYDFVIGSKTPMYRFYPILYTLKVYVIEMAPQILEVDLKQTAILPSISCIKELWGDIDCKLTQNQSDPISIDSHQSQGRLLKFYQIKGKSKKQVKVSFTYDGPMRITVSLQLLGLRKQFNQEPIQLKPQQLCLFQKGQFILNFKINFIQEIVDALQVLNDHAPKNQQNLHSQKIPSIDIRRVLVIKINQTNFHFHYPIEVSYMLNRKESSFEP